VLGACGCLGGLQVLLVSPAELPAAHGRWVAALHAGRGASEQADGRWLRMRAAAAAFAWCQQHDGRAQPHLRAGCCWHATHLLPCPSSLHHCTPPCAAPPLSTLPCHPWHPQIAAVKAEAAAATAALHEKVAFQESDKRHLGIDLKEAKDTASKLREQVQAAQAAQADTEQQLDRLTQHLDSTEVGPGQPPAACLPACLLA
jgi:hypothetical protein